MTLLTRDLRRFPGFVGLVVKDAIGGWNNILPFAEGCILPCGFRVGSARTKVKADASCSVPLIQGLTCRVSLLCTKHGPSKGLKFHIG